MKKLLLLISICIIANFNLFSQITIDQNGLKTSVTNTLYANATQAQRYEITTVAYNSYHWQYGGLIIIELYEQLYGTGYEKYVVENGFGQGANSGSPVIKLIESHGIYHYAKITLGNAIDLSTTYGGFVNRALPIYLDVRYYGGYKARITYLQDKVDELTSLNQIKINEEPTPSVIPDFDVSTEIIKDYDVISSGNLRISGNGNHYIQNGTVGIGTTTPNTLYKLDVAGSIRANEIKVNTTGADFVFEPTYKLRPLAEVETFINQHKHLPEVAPAADMQTNGVSMGEMQAKLLQKVEELTLYVIELEKQNSQFKAKLIEQDQKYQDLTKKLKR